MTAVSCDLAKSAGGTPAVHPRVLVHLPRNVCVSAWSLASPQQGPAGKSSPPQPSCVGNRRSKRHVSWGQMVVAHGVRCRESLTLALFVSTTGLLGAVGLIPSHLWASPEAHLRLKAGLWAPASAGEAPGTNKGAREYASCCLHTSSHSHDSPEKRVPGLAPSYR